MEAEQLQSKLIDEFVQRSSTLTASYLTSLVLEATSHPSLFSFSEILSVPNIIQLGGTENSRFLHLLRLFAYGTWLDYTSNASTLPPLVPSQVVKLKQLTVLTLTKSNKVITYDALMKQLEINNVRELEDFLINECIYTGLVKGKLNQLQRCFEVQFAIGRDLINGELESMMDTLKKWEANSENLLSFIQEKIEWTCRMHSLHKNHQNEVQARIDAAEHQHPHPHPRPFKDQFVVGYDDNFLDFDAAVLHEEKYPRYKRRRSPTVSRQRRLENL